MNAIPLHYVLHILSSLLAIFGCFPPEILSNLLTNPDHDSLYSIRLSGCWKSQNDQGQDGSRQGRIQPIAQDIKRATSVITTAPSLELRLLVADVGRSGQTNSSAGDDDPIDVVEIAGKGTLAMGSVTRQNPASSWLTTVNSTGRSSLLLCDPLKGLERH
jgi:hypothetical protein